LRDHDLKLILRWLRFSAPKANRLGK